MTRREEPSYYCCICESPFTPDRLRKATTASSGEDERDFALFKDFCDCGYGGPHDESCAELKEYDGDLLPSGRIAVRFFKRKHGLSVVSNFPIVAHACSDDLRESRLVRVGPC